MESIAGRCPTIMESSWYYEKFLEQLLLTLMKHFTKQSYLYVYVYETPQQSISLRETAYIEREYATTVIQ